MYKDDTYGKVYRDYELSKSQHVIVDLGASKIHSELQPLDPASPSFFSQKHQSSVVTNNLSESTSASSSFALEHINLNYKNYAQLHEQELRARDTTFKGNNNNNNNNHNSSNMYLNKFSS